MTTTRRGLRRLLGLYPLEWLAARIGVKPATLARWKTKGVPKGQQKRLDAAVVSLRGVKLPTKRERTRLLKKLAPESLASLSGATVSQVKRWQRSGDIPVAFRQFLIDPSPEPVPTNETAPETSWITGVGDVYREAKSGKTVTAYSYLSDGRVLTDSTLVEILAFFGSPPSANPYDYYYFQIVGVTRLGPKDDFGYQQTDFVKGLQVPQDVRVMTQSSGFMAYNSALSSFEEKLLEALQAQLKLEKITLFVRNRKR